MTFTKVFESFTNAIYGVCELNSRFAAEFVGVRTRRPWWSVRVNAENVRIRSPFYGIEFSTSNGGWLVVMTISPDLSGYYEVMAKAITLGWRIDDVAVVNRYVMRACGLLLEESGLL